MSPTPPPSLRIGTRASALATTQTGRVAARLEALTGWPIETVHVRTEGDVRTGSLASMGGTGVFVTALRDAVLGGECDVAVHSLKDLPTIPAPGLTLVTPERENPHDALCARGSTTLAALPRGARVGTGSPRRAAQLLATRPDLRIVDIRGNVDTRLTRAMGPDADLDAVVLAYAGLARLGRLDAISEVLDPSIVCPAPGQGALGVEVRTDLLAADSSRTTDERSDRPTLAAAFAALDHTPTRLAVTAERALLARLEAGCAAPIGAHAVIEKDVLTLLAVVVRADGTEQLAHTAHIDLPHTGAKSPHASDATARGLGIRVAEALLADGAAALCPDLGVARP